MKKRIALIISVVLSVVFFIPAISVYAYELPNSVSFKEVIGSRNLVENGDMLIAFHYRVFYNDEDDIPDTQAYNIYTFTLFDTDGSTVLATQSPYVFFENGFQEGISGFYFSAADAPTYGSAYILRISAVPGAFSPQPNPINYTITSSDYTDSDDQETNQAVLGAWLAVEVKELEDIFNVTLIGEMEYGDVLNSTAEVYLRGCIRGIQAMAPDIFFMQFDAPDWTTTEWSTNQTDAYAGRYTSTIIGNAATGLGDLLGIGGTLAFGSIFIVIGVILIINARRKYQSPAPGFTPFALCILAGVLMGGVNGAVIIVMGLVATMIAGYLIWRPVG